MNLNKSSYICIIWIGHRICASYWIYKSLYAVSIRLPTCRHLHAISRNNIERVYSEKKIKPKQYKQQQIMKWFWIVWLILVQSGPIWSTERSGSSNIRRLSLMISQRGNVWMHFHCLLIVNGVHLCWMPMCGWFIYTDVCYIEMYVCVHVLWSCKC